MRAEVAGEKVQQKVVLAAGETKTVILDVSVESPKLWTPQTPNLYQLKVVLNKQNKIIDNFEFNVGFRTFEVRNSRFYLNDQPRWMGGANMPPHGLRPNDERLANKFFQLMHDGNQFITRSHASPLTPVWAAAADRQGVAVSLEGTWPWMMLRDAPITPEPLLEAWRAEMRSLVRSLRNHPSIVKWTIANELKFHPRFHRDDPETYIKKMTILSDMIKEIRKLDPTRPICVWSQYVRDPRIHRELLVPNNIDDGDVTAPHLYLGWYQSSVWQCRRYGGNYLPVFTGQAIMSPEASSGYSNNDTGHPQRFFTQLYVPQIWVGDDAYEHRDPAPFLAHKALMTKEWMEDVRRTRRTAGWMAFANICWFQYVSFVDHIRPFPVYEAVKLALADVLISLDQRDRHHFAGNIFKGSLVVVNDCFEGKGLTGLTVKIRLLAPDGKCILEIEKEMPDTPYFGRSEVEFSFMIPEKLPVSRADYILQLALYAGERKVGENRYTLLLADETWASPKLNTKPRIVLLGNDAAIRHRLLQLGVDLLAIQDIEAADAVIWTGTEPPGRDSEKGKRLLGYVAKGGSLMLLETGAADRLIPEGIVKERLKQTVEFVNIERPEQAIFEGINAHDLKWWNGNGRSPRACAATYMLSPDANVWRLGEEIPLHGYGWRGPKSYPVFIVPQGEGIILVSELRISTSHTDPIAARILRNKINMIETSCKTQ